MTTIPNWFPGSPAQAPYPSPEGALMTVENGKPVGSPYLKDAQGTVWKIAVGATGLALSFNAGAGIAYQFTINGVASQAPSMCGTQWIVRQGQVYYAVPGGGWAQPEKQDDPQSGQTVNLTLPPAWINGVPPPPAVVAMPTDPPKSAVAPGSSGTIVLAGPSQAIKTITAALAVAKAGDTIQLDAGSFAEGFEVNVPLLFKGAALDANGKPTTTVTGIGVPLSAYPAGGRGGVVPNGVDTTWENIAFTGWGLLSTSSDLTSAIRPIGQMWLTCVGCTFTGNQCGIGTDGASPPNQVVTLNGCDAQGNGLSDGYSHNFYFGDGTVRIVLSGTSSGTPVAGHALKSRAWGLAITGGTFDAAQATPIDVPDGTAAPFTISGATINKSATDANHGILSYCTETTNNSTAGGTVAGTINALCPNPIVEIAAGTVSFAGVTWSGNPVTNSGAGTATRL